MATIVRVVLSWDVMRYLNLIMRPLHGSPKESEDRPKSYLLFMNCIYKLVVKYFASTYTILCACYFNEFDPHVETKFLQTKDIIR